MIFPTVNFSRALSVNNEFFLFREGLVNKVDNRVEIADVRSLAMEELCSEDGASLRYNSKGSEYGGSDFELVYEGEGNTFQNCLLVSFGEGWLVLRCLVEESHSGYIAFNYVSSRTIDFSRDQAAALYYYSGFFFARTRRKWQVYDSLGVNVHEFAISRDGEAPSNMPDLYRFGDSVYLNAGGENGDSFLDRFSLSLNKKLGRIVWEGYIGCATSWEGGIFFIDRCNIYRANPEDLKSSQIIASLPEDMMKGDVWLWADFQHLYLASTAADTIYAYGPDGILQGVAKIPAEWRFSGNKPEVHDGQNILLLYPYDLSEWGSAAVLLWRAGEFSTDSMMQQERLRSFSVKTVSASDEGHGFRLVLQSATLEVAVRHAAHHLVRQVHKVAPGLMNRGAKIDEEFNGLVEIELITSEPFLADSLYANYLLELFCQIKKVPFSYKAGDYKTALVLKLYWSATMGGRSKLVCTSDSVSG